MWEIVGGQSDLVSCEGQMMSDEASSNVELDLDSADKVALILSIFTIVFRIDHRRFDVI